MIRVEIVSPAFDERSGEKNGKAWTIREQEGYAHVLGQDGKPQKYPVLCSVPLEKDQPPYQPGFYQLDPRSVMVGEYKRLAFGRVKLLPLKAA